MTTEGRFPQNSVSLDRASTRLAEVVISTKISRELGRAAEIDVLMVFRFGRWTVVLGHELVSDLAFAGASRCSDSDRWNTETGVRIAAWRAAQDIALGMRQSPLPLPELKNFEPKAGRN